MPYIIETDRQNIEHIIEAEQSVTLMEAIKAAGLDELSRCAADAVRARRAMSTSVQIGTARFRR